jgi:hypothetical protein
MKHITRLLALRTPITGHQALIETRSPPGLLAPTLVTLPSMSRVPRAPFFFFLSYFPCTSTIFPNAPDFITA